MNIPVIAMKSHSLEKSFSSIPRIIKNKAPHYAPNNDPIFIVDISIAYIVASIFFGHILQANTNSGIIFNSPTSYNIMESPIQNNLSSIPHSTFLRVTSMMSDS